MSGHNESSQRATTLGVSQETLLGKVRQALGRLAGQAIAAAPKVDPNLVRLATADEDLVALFTKRATETGMKVYRVQAADLLRQIGSILEEAKAKRVACAVGTLPQAVGLNDALRRRGLEVVDWQAQPGFEAQYELDAGITDVHAALAETGTLICNSDAGHSRGLSLVPPVHIAIVRQSDILPDMVDYWLRVRSVTGKDLPSSQALITGPSKTADIEGILITGVHGPGQVHILVVEKM
ncbi:MAG: lactate utilization protein [Phycisphaeraceae bacterium]|nr:lactate utilization protein [Phycisphaeraceae bacterium]